MKEVPSYFEYNAKATDASQDTIEWPDIVVGERPITHEEWRELQLMKPVKLADEDVIEWQR